MTGCLMLARTLALNYERFINIRGRCVNTLFWSDVPLNGIVQFSNAEEGASLELSANDTQ